MFKRKSNNNVNQPEQFTDDIDTSVPYVDPYFEEEDIDNILNDVSKPPAEKRKRRRSPEEFYVKGADLIEEIKKYQQSKREDAEINGIPYEER